MLRTGRLRTPKRGGCRSTSTPVSQPMPGAVLPRTLASPRTGLTPAGCRELVARLRHHDLLVVTAPELLDARWNPNPRFHVGAACSLSECAPTSVASMSIT